MLWVQRKNKNIFIFLIGRSRRDLYFLKFQTVNKSEFKFH